MANEIRTDEDLLKQLKIPNLDTGEPIFVSGFEDFARMTTLSDSDYNKYVTYLYDSLNDVSADVAERTSNTLSEMLKEVAAKRSEVNRFRAIPTSPGLVRPPEDRTSAATAAYSAIVLGAHTMIGPAVIDNEMPIVDVEINESYDVEPVPTVNSRTDPVVKGNKNDISISITLEVPGYKMNGKIRDDGTVESWGLRELLASLRVAPICEIVSPAIIPVFVNNILTPELFQQLRQQVAANRPQNKQQLKDLMESQIKHGLRDNISSMDRPPNAPTVEQIKQLPSATMLKDQGVYPSWGHPEFGFVANSPIDGDTVNLSNGDKVRLIGINTPEIRSHGNESEGQVTADSIQPGGVEATNFLAQYVGQTVYIEYGQESTDKYGRKLAYLYTADGKQINLQIAKAKRWDPNAPSSPGIVSLPGAAVPIAREFPIYPNTKYRSTYTAALSESYSRSVGEFVEMLGSLNEFLDFMDEDSGVRDAAVSNSDPSVAAAISTERMRKGASIAVACAFRGVIVETVPGKSNTFFAKLVFTKYNDNAWYPGKLMYRDQNGEPTANAVECPWIGKLAAKTLLDDRLAGLSGHHYMSPYVSGKEEDPAIVFTWEDPLAATFQTYATEPSRFTVEGIRAQMTMKAASLPLQGGPYPVAHYMGESNMLVRIKAVVTDPLELAKFHEMKSELDKINYIGPAPEIRKPSVSIKNNLLNFLGTRDYVIAGVTTRTDNSQKRWELEITLIESRLSFADIEALTVSTQEQLQVHDAKLIWDRMYDLLSEKVDFKQLVQNEDGTHDYENVSGYKILNPDFSRPSRKDELDGEGEAAYALVFGDPIKFGSVLHPNMVAATWYYMRMPKNKDGSLPVWDTSFRANPGISDIMEGRTGDNIPSGFGPTILIADHPQDTEDFFDVQYALPAVRKKSGATGKFDIADGGARFVDSLGVLFRRSRFFTREFWNTYFNLVMNDLVRSDQNIANPAWTSDDISAARSYIYGIINTGFYENFPSVAPRMRSIDGERMETKIPIQSSGKPRLGEANYADLIYPTYSAMFSKDGKLLSIPVNVVAAQIGSVELWRKFAPTYADLGKKAPYSRMTMFKDPEDAQNETARNLNDFVEPTMPYYHFRMRAKAVGDNNDREERFWGAMDRIRAHTIIVPKSETDRGELSNWLKSLYTKANERSVDSSFDKQRYYDLLHALADKDLSEQKLQETLRRLNMVSPPKMVYMFSQEGEFLGTVRPGGVNGTAYTFNKSDTGERWKVFSGLGIDVFEIMDPNHSIMTYRDVIDRVPDSGAGMFRMYPSYRLFFIERDRNTLYMSDDLYGLNSVVSFSLRKEKYGADVLMATISNVTDNLAFEEVIPPSEKSEFLSKGVAKDLGLAADDASEPYSSRMKVRPGTDIQLRMGYGNKWTDLGIVFTGCITEVRPGKIVQIVAQGHKRELMNEIQMTYGGLNHFDIIRKILERTEHPHLGTQVRPFAYGSAYFRQLFPAQVDNRQLISQLDVWFNTAFTTAMRNVYVASNARLESSRVVVFDRGAGGFFGTATNAAGVLMSQQYIDIGRSGFFGGIWEGTKTGVSFGAFAGYKGALFGAALGSVLGLGIGAIHLAEKYFAGREYYLGGTYATWIVPPQTAWDAISEVTRHRPGHIVQVVPFEHEATLFVGMPEQPYFAEQPSVRETVNYNKKVMPILAQAGREFRDLFLRPFIAKKNGWFDAYLASIKLSRAMFYEKGVERALWREFHEDYDLPTGASFDWEVALLRHIFADGMSLTGGNETFRYAGNDINGTFTIQDDRIIFYEKAAFGGEPRKSVGRYPLSRMLKAVMENSTSRGNLPPGMKLVDIPMPTDDVSDDWRYIKDVHPDLQRHAFYWYFGIDPQRGELVVKPTVNTVDPIFLSKDSGVYKDRVQLLGSDPNDVLAMPYRNVSGILGPDAGAAAAAMSFSAPGKVPLLGIPLATAEEEDIERAISTADDLKILIRERLSQPDSEPIAKAYNENKSLASLVHDMGSGFRRFVFYFAKFLKEESLKGDGSVTRARAEQIMKKFRFYSLPPGYRVFSSMHYIGPREIISNGLYASMEEMSNCLLLRAPADHVDFKDSEGTINIQYETTDWRSYPSTDGIAFNERVAKRNRKLGVVAEMNAIGPDQKFRVTLSDMAEMMRPMYRGRILIVGTDLKPHDVIYLNDIQNDVKGLLEVASVTHHFSTETGWVTEIEPHALIRVNSPTSEAHLAALAVYMRQLYGMDDLISDASSVAMVALLAVGVGGLRIPVKSLGTQTVAGAVSKGSIGMFRKSSEAVRAVMRKELGAASVQWFNKNVAAPIYHGSGASILTGIGRAMRGPAAGSGIGNSMGAFISYLGRHSLSVKGGVAAGLLYTGGALSDVAFDMYAKSELRASTLPLDVMTLRYRGASFTAGLEVEDEDMFGFLDSMYGLARDIRRDVREGARHILSDMAGATVGGQPAQRAAQLVSGRGGR